MLILDLPNMLPMVYDRTRNKYVIRMFTTLAHDRIVIANPEKLVARPGTRAWKGER